MKPKFVSVKLLKDGTAELIDYDGEVWGVEMDYDLEWPFITSRIRQREMRRSSEERRRKQVEPKPTAPTGPFIPKIVG